MRIRTSAWLFAVVLLLLIGCSRQGAQSFPDGIPRADQKVYMSILDMQDWKNPYLIVFPDGVKLAGDDTLFPVSDIINRLSALPASSWPYGRVVAISIGGLHAEAEVETTWKETVAVLNHLQITINPIPRA